MLQLTGVKYVQDLFVMNTESRSAELYNYIADSVVKVIIDRPMGSRHPEHGFIYPVNYGYIPGTLAEDGEEIDAYVLGEFEPLDSYEGVVIGIIIRNDDNEDKLVVSRHIGRYGAEEIKALTEFQERFFDSHVISFIQKAAK